MCADSYQTRPDLLLRLHDTAAGEAWREFVHLYAPLVHRWCRRHGLQDADAADVTQSVLQAVSAAIPHFCYDATKGRFRSWLATLTRRHLSAHFAAVRRRRLTLRSSDALDALASESASEATLDHEAASRRFRVAAGRARAHFEERTWRAFWRSAIEGTGTAELADELGMSVGAVYVARCRVLARIKELACQVTT